MTDPDTDPHPRPTPASAPVLTPNPAPVSAPALARHWRLLALGLILLVGAALRMTDLEHVPYGIWFDEAINGMDAVNVWRPGGHFRMYYSVDIGFPHEPMFQTGINLVVGLFGPSVVAVRMYSAVVGLLTVLLVYLFTRRFLGEAVGLASAGVLATLRWHVLFSHLSFRTLILGPWMLGLVWAALAYGRRRSAARAALLGFFIGGGFYTYLAWWFLLPAVALAVALIARRAWAAPGGRRHLAALALAAVLTYLPMGLYFVQHPDIVTRRGKAVSIFAGGPAAAVHAILKNAGETALMFHFWGDHVPIQNLSGPGALAALVFKALGIDPAREKIFIGHPALDPIQGLAFLLGLVLAVQLWRRGRRMPEYTDAHVAPTHAAPLSTPPGSDNEAQGQREWGRLSSLPFTPKGLYNEAQGQRSATVGKPTANPPNPEGVPQISPSPTPAPAQGDVPSDTNLTPQGSNFSDAPGEAQRNPGCADRTTTDLRRGPTFHLDYEERPDPALIPLLLAWLGCGLASTVFSQTDSPNFLRTLCVTPVVAILTGLGLAAAGRWLARRRGLRAGVALVALALCASGAQTAWSLYGDWAHRASVWHGFHGDLTDLAHAACQAGDGVAVMVPADLAQHPAFRFQTAARTNIATYSTWPELLGPWPPSAPARAIKAPRVRWIIVTAANGLYEPIHQMIPDARDIKDFRAPEGNTWAVLLSIPEDALPAPAQLAQLQQAWPRPMSF